MTKKDEALKMAIEALLTGNQHADAINACKEALEQPAQEPVMLNVKTHDDTTYKVEVSTHQWQGLTDDEIGNLITPYEYSVHPDLDGLCRAIEQALKDKNT